ncbi:hypothetical protein [Kitasatospora acidiphila]
MLVENQGRVDYGPRLPDRKTKGPAWINGFALGRYWSRRPQQNWTCPHRS